MANKIRFRIAYLYFPFLALALLYGMGLVKKAYNYREADLEYTQKEMILEDNALRIVFSNGYITMYYKNVPFTDFNGLASSFTVEGVDYPTFKARWKIEKISPVELFATNEWPGLPIKQVWHLLLKEGKLNWQIDLESKKDINMINVGLVFLFRNNYQEWVSLYGQGRVPVLGALQQRKGIRFGLTENALGLNTVGKDEKSFPAIGVTPGKESFFINALLSSCRSMLSEITYLSLAFGGKEPLRVLQNSKIILSSGEMSLFDKKNDLLEYFMMKQNKIKN